MKHKKLLYTFLPIFVMALLATSVTYAATTGTAKHNPFSKVAEAIANKFNLSTTDVQAVIDETMTAERAEMEKDRPARVDPIAQAVTDGKLTQAQADLITAKREELKSSMENFKDLTQTERATAMKTQMESLKQWATDNNIPEQYIMFGQGRGLGRGGEHGFGGPNQNFNSAPASQSSNSAN